MRSILMIFVFAVIQIAGLAAKADSFYIDQNGKRYLCDQVSGGSDGSCWDKCPLSFSSCASSCGGGNECWDKCPLSFSSCASACGAGDSCWDQCPLSFSSCAGSCGGGKSCWDKCPLSFSSCASACGSKGLTPNTLTRILNTAKERAQFEQKLLQEK